MIHARPAWLIVSVLLLGGCQATNPTLPASTPVAPSSGEPTTSSGPGNSPGQGASPGADGETEWDVPAGIIVGAGDFFLEDPAAGLGGLGSHRATLTISFDGTRAGAASRWSRTTTLVTTGSPRAVALEVEQKGDLAEAPLAWGAERDGLSYRLDPDGACVASVVDPEATDLAEPAALLSSILGGDAAGRETINGIETDVFTFDENALGLPADAPSTGRVWVAADGGYVVRLELATTGADPYFGEDVAGVLTTEYVLSEVNGPVSIELPKGCPLGPVDAPLPNGATAVDSGPGSTRFMTNLSSADVVAFYEDRASELGWKVAGQTAVDKTAGFADFTSGDVHIAVIATKSGDGTRVEILTTKSGR